MPSTFTKPTSLPAMNLAAAKRFGVGPASLAHPRYSSVVGRSGCFLETAVLPGARNTKLKSTERNALNSLIGTFSVERPEMFDFAHPKRM